MAPGGSYNQKCTLGDKWEIRSGNANPNGQILARVQGQPEAKTYRVEGKTCDTVYSLAPPSIESFTVGKDCVYKSRWNQQIKVIRNSSGEITGIKGQGTSN